MGTGLFASSDIATGQDVLYIKVPFVAVLDTARLEDTCSGCFGKKQFENDQIELKGCTGCQVVRYCDKACQAKDWKFAHSLECPIFRKLRPRILPNNARAVLRMVLRYGRQKYDEQDLAIFFQLETHIQEIRERNEDQWNRISLSAKAIKEYSGTAMQEELISAVGAKLDLNSFNLTNALYDRIGLYLHPYVALINHSCDYNSVFGFDGDELFVKAIRPIKKGDQIFISYVDVTNPYKIRQKELSDRYFFTCQCSQCKRGIDTPQDAFLTSASKDSSALEAAEEKAYRLMESVDVDVEPLQTVDQLMSAMHVLRQTSIWPISRQPYVSCRDELVTSLMFTGQFNKAFIQAAIRYIRVDPVVYRYDVHPIRHVHAWALAKLAIHLSQGTELNPDDSDAVQKAELNLSFIVWSILHELVKREPESCTVPSFKQLVRTTFQEVHTVLISNGVDQKTLKTEISKEWDKLERVIRAQLGKE